MENKTVLFSIIIPIYNVEAYLSQAIESVLSQSVSDWELILVDDGSTDCSGEICDRYAALDGRIRVIHKPNGGLVSARQAGVAQCRGMYILNLDGDDYWDGDFLYHLESVIVQYHPDGILFGYRKVTEDGRPIGELYNKPAEGFHSGTSLAEIWDRMLYDPNYRDINNNMGAFCNGIVLAAFRREIVAPLQQIVPTQIKMGEDAAVTIPAVCRCKSIYFGNKIGYNYRMRRDSISHAFSRSQMQELELLTAHLKKYADHLPAWNLGCYTYRKMEGYWINAARNLPNYREFRACVSDSFNTISEDAIGHISQCPLKLKYRLRLFVVKHNLWYVLWLFYHRK